MARWLRRVTSGCKRQREWLALRPGAAGAVRIARQGPRSGVTVHGGSVRDKNHFRANVPNSIMVGFWIADDETGAFIMAAPWEVSTKGVSIRHL